jgi:hypothetical protein
MADDPISHPIHASSPLTKLYFKKPLPQTLSALTSHPWKR